MSSELKACPFCGGEKVVPIIKAPYSMFEQSIVIDRCPHFYDGLDGNHATCVRYSPFIEEYPDCSKCDVYAELSGDKVVGHEMKNMSDKKVVE